MVAENDRQEIIPSDMAQGGSGLTSAKHKAPKVKIVNHTLPTEKHKKIPLPVL
jgi:hypothetical protein